MLSKLKNWWFTIAFALGAILDLGFDVLNPVLIELGVDKSVIAVVKVVFIIYGVVRLKLSIPKNKINP